MSQLRANVEYSKYKKALETSINDIVSRESIKTLTVEKCPSVDDVITLLSQEWFQETLFGSFSSLIALRMKINLSSIAYPSEWKPRLSGLSDNPSLLITLESTEGNQCILYWRNHDSKDFLKLNLTDESINKDIIDYTIDFIVKALEKENGSVTFVNSNVMSLASLVSSTGYNLLLTAVVEGNFEMVQHLLKQPFDINEDIYVGNEIGSNDENAPCFKRLIDFAWESDNDEISLTLLKAGSSYPKDFYVFAASDEILDFLDVSKTLHKHIKEGKIEDIRMILDENKDQRYFFNKHNVSAVHRAIKCKNEEIYKMLIENNLSFGPDEEFKGRLPKEFGTLLYAINTERAQKLPQHHITLLLSKSVIPRWNTEHNRTLRFVKKSFTTLDSISLIRPILVVVSVNRRTKIHFDFTQWSVVFMDPILSPSTRGAFNISNKHLHIGAKDFLYDFSRCTAEATMIHEFTHSALDDTFCNERLPYGKDDEVNREKWAKVMEECKANKDFDYIVASVFKCYDEETWGRELAVRAPQMIVCYQNDETKLNELKIIFKSLFEYHEKFVVPAMIAAAPVLEKIANEFDICYNKLTDPMKAALRHAQVNFQGELVKLGKIASKNELEKLTSQQIREILEERLLKISAEEKVQKKVKVYIKRRFIKRNYRKIRKALDFQDLYEEVSITKVLLLADKAGTGKSTTMRHLRDELKKKNPHFWISYIDLKRYTHIYQETNENLNIFEVVKKILGIVEGSFESAVFAHLFESNRVILLLDGVDEVAPKYKKFFLTFVSSMKKNTKNQLWIATRPQHAPDLSKLLQCYIYKLLPLSETNVYNFFNVTLRAEGVDDAETLRSSILACFVFVKIEKNENNNPLLLQMLSKLAIAGRLPTTTYNLCDVYEQMIELKRDIVTEEKGAVVNRDMLSDSRLSINEVHMIYALKLFFPDGEVTRKIVLTKTKSIPPLKLFQRFERDKTSWSPEKVSRLGLLLVDGWETPEETPDFVHRTFADFFAIKFIAESLKDVAHEWTEGELCETQFYERMEILLNISYGLIEKSDPAFRFIVNHLRRLRLIELPCRDIFTKLLEKTEVIELLRKSIRDADDSVVIEIVRLFGHSEKLLNMISRFGEDSLTLFQTCVRNEKFDRSLRLFDAFRRSQLPNWHRLTGYGLKLDSSQLRLASDKELKQLKRNLEKDANLYHTIDDHSDEIVFLSFHLFYFIESINDFSTDDAAKLLMSFFNDISCVLTMRSRMVIDKVFIIIRKHWGESKCASVRKILMSLLSRVSSDLIFYPRVVHSTIISNTEHIMSKYGVYFEPDAKTSEKPDALSDAVKKFDLIYVAVLHDIKCLKKFYRRFMESQEILQTLADKFSWFISYFSTREDIKRFDNFIAETSQGELTSYFQLFLVHSKDLESILRLCGMLMQLFNDDWLDHVGYSAKKVVGVSKLFTAEQIEEFVTKTEENDVERSKIVNICRLLNALWLCAIPSEHFEKIRENFVEEITKAVEKHENLLEATKRVFKHTKIDDEEEEYFTADGD